MRVLFDQGTPEPLRRFLPQHEVATAYERGWSNISNGLLLKMAENAGYEVFITTDKGLRYQQNLTSRRMAIVVLFSTSWPRLQRGIASIVAAVNSAVPGSYSEVETP